MYKIVLHTRYISDSALADNIDDLDEAKTLLLRLSKELAGEWLRLSDVEYKSYSYNNERYDPTYLKILSL